MNLNTFIDHTLLKNTASETDFNNLINEAITYGFFCVCVPPHIVKHTHEKLKNSPIKTCSVAGFPLGYNTLEDKKNEINHLYSIGCDEVDVVLNISNIKDQNWSLVENEFRVFSNFFKKKCLKVIIESGILSNNELIKVCKIATQHPVTFLKTSTGFAKIHSTLKAVQIMRKHLPKKVLIKASGGIKNQSQALNFIKAGANRLGCSASINIIKGDL